MCATNDYFNRGVRAPVGLTHWRSRKLARVAGSPQLVGTYAASSAVVEMAWVKALWESMTWTDYDLILQRRRSQLPVSQIKPVVRSACPVFADPEAILVVDSKGLHDALDNDLPQDDRRSALEVPTIEEFPHSIRGKVRWTPHNHNPADATTNFRGAHAEPTVNMIQTGMHRLGADKDEVEARKAHT